MSPARRARDRDRERRRTASAAPTAPLAPISQAGGHGPPGPVWKWRTLPVFFAFALGGFLGVHIGAISWATDDTTPWFIGVVVFAMMLGLALSRIVTRLLVAHAFIKARPKRRTP